MTVGIRDAEWIIAHNPEHVQNRDMAIKGISIHFETDVQGRPQRAGHEEEISVRPDEKVDLAQDQRDGTAQTVIAHRVIIHIIKALHQKNGKISKKSKKKRKNQKR